MFVLQEDQDPPSPGPNTEVSPVSQAWFTTKEDKDTLTNKGKQAVVMETEDLQTIFGATACFMRQLCSCRCVPGGFLCAQNC